MNIQKIQRVAQGKSRFRQCCIVRIQIESEMCWIPWGSGRFPDPRLRGPWACFDMGDVLLAALQCAATVPGSVTRLLAPQFGLEDGGKDRGHRIAENDASHGESDRPDRLRDGEGLDHAGQGCRCGSAEGAALYRVDEILQFDPAESEGIEGFFESGKKYGGGAACCKEDEALTDQGLRRHELPGYGYREDGSSRSPSEVEPVIGPERRLDIACSMGCPGACIGI